MVTRHGNLHIRIQHLPRASANYYIHYKTRNTHCHHVFNIWNSWQTAPDKSHKNRLVVNCKIGHFLRVLFTTRQYKPKRAYNRFYVSWIDPKCTFKLFTCIHLLVCFGGKAWAFHKKDADVRCVFGQSKCLWLSVDWSVIDSQTQVWSVIVRELTKWGHNWLYAGK